MAGLGQLVQWASWPAGPVGQLAQLASRSSGPVGPVGQSVHWASWPSWPVDQLVQLVQWASWPVSPIGPVGQLANRSSGPVGQAGHTHSSFCVQRKQTQAPEDTTLSVEDLRQAQVGARTYKGVRQQHVDGWSGSETSVPSLLPVEFETFVASLCQNSPQKFYFKEYH